MNIHVPFEQVVTEHGATILRVCRAVLGPSADADDAWSETFLAALMAWPDRVGVVNVEAWLVTIAHRKAIDITRARARHAIPVATIPDRTSAQGVPGDQDQHLWDAVAALPDKQRHAVAYHYLAGLPHKTSPRSSVAHQLLPVARQQMASRTCGKPWIRQVRKREELPYEQHRV